ncbi:MAG: cell envelope integrity protein TolA [Beijerinckiaceae bacterium]|nr:cell envelope integrity protein TolA [Beijerinckiaceae bacterium]MCZ8300833.1 cell envelope integrity protein TolA [Beijerinckiaceae bacterium]
MPKALVDNLKGAISWREPGTLVSTMGHALVLGLGLYSFSSAKPFNPAQEAVAVDVVSDQQFSEMMRGDKESKIVAPTPERRIDRVAEIKEDKDPGQAKRDVPTPPSRSEPQQVETKPEPQPQQQQLAAIIPPTRPPELRVAPPVPTPPVKAEEDDQEDEKAELLRRKKIEEQRKLEEAKAAAEARRKLDEKLKAEAEAQKRAEDLKKAEEQKKAEELKKAEEQKKAEERRKAEAEKKAREEKARREAAEEQKLNDAIRNRLLASREAPASTGSTGAAVNTRSTAGTAQATGSKLSPSDRSQLIGILTEQMNRCLNYSGSAPKTGPQITFTLGRDGAIVSQLQLANRSGEPNFVPFAEASMRALRNCQPYRIPARFMDTYEDWKNVRLNFDTSEMQ